MRYADPAVCPDCRLTIQPGTPSCPRCRLDLSGTDAASLFAILSSADRQLAAMARVPAVATPASPAPYPVDHRQAAPARSKPTEAKPAGSVVPRVLLGLGALCLLVAALVFLAVTWSVLGVTGRTLVLFTVTAAAGAATAWACRGGLRAAAESLLSVTAGLVALDVVGVDRAAWFGETSGPMVSLMLGTALLALGTIAALAARRTRVSRLLAAEIVAAIGTAVAVFGAFGTADGTPAVRTLLPIALGAALALGAGRLRLPVLAWSAAGVTGCWWLVLVAIGFDRATTGPNLDGPTFAGLWGGLWCWPLLVAGLLPLALTVRPRHPAVRVAAVAVVVAVLLPALLLPAVDEALWISTGTAMVVLLAAQAVALRLPRPWLATLALPWGVAALVVVTTTLTGLALGAEALLSPASDAPWRRDALDRAIPHDGPLSVWLVVAGAATLVAVTLSLPVVTARVLGRPRGPIGGRPWLHVVVLGTLGYAAAAWCGRFEVPLVLPAIVAALTVLALGLPSPWSRRAPIATPVAALTVAVLSLVLTCATQAGTTVVLAAVVAGLVAHGTIGSAELRTPALTVLPVPLAGLALAGIDLSGAPIGLTVAVTLVLLGSLILWRVEIPVEVVAGVTAFLVLFGAVLAETSAGRWSLWCTLLGALLVAAGLRHGRPLLRWAGAGTLTIALWARLVDLGVETVEAYTLPVAAALLGYGLWMMHRRGLGSTPALGAGLALGLTPSLLLVLADPVSLRAVLLGVGCCAALAAGAALRWSAPLVAGGVGLALLVLREATYADVLPQWVLIGAIGLALTVVGVTWERRLADLRSAADFVRRLR